MVEAEVLQFDETALCLFHHLQLLYEDAHAWFKDTYNAYNPHVEDKFLRIQDIAIERTEVSLDFSEYIVYVLLADRSYKTGTPGISLTQALLIKQLVTQGQLRLGSQNERNELHDTLRTLDLITELG